MQCVFPVERFHAFGKTVSGIIPTRKTQFWTCFLCMNPGYNEENWRIIQENAKLLDIPLTTFETQIFDSVAEVDKNPCYLCARMRRGISVLQGKRVRL